MKSCSQRSRSVNSAACNSYNAILGGRVSEQARYTITFVPGSVTTNTYRLQATRQAARGPDPECGVLSIDQSGLRNRSGNAPMERCW